MYAKYAIAKSASDVKKAAVNMTIMISIIFFVSFFGVLVLPANPFPFAARPPNWPHLATTNYYRGKSARVFYTQ